MAATCRASKRHMSAWSLMALSILAVIAQTRIPPAVDFEATSVRKCSQLYPQAVKLHPSVAGRKRQAKGIQKG